MKPKISRNSPDEEIIARDMIGEVTVSTIFVGADAGRTHEVLGLYETKIFGGPLDGQTERYGTHEAALDGHRRWIEKVEAAVRC